MSESGPSEPGLTQEQRNLLDALARSLRPEQALWLSGFFAGLGYGAPAADAAAQGLPINRESSRSLTVLVGSETGNSAALAKSFAQAATTIGRPTQMCDMADYKIRKLKDEQDLVVITSTHGEGDPPQSAVAFFEFLEGRKAPQLPNVRYAVLALGDSTYERYCEGGKRIDRRLSELGASALMPRVDCDVDYDEAAAAWLSAVLAALRPVDAAEDGPGARATSPRVVIPSTRGADPGPAFDKRHPFEAAIIDNIELTGRGSSKETRHIELSLAGSGLTFEPGDALGVLPTNDPGLVSTILDSLALSADVPVAVKERATSLGEALAKDFEITVATPRLLDHWAQLSGGMDELQGEGNAAARAAFLREHHVIDLIRRFPVKGIDAQTFLTGLRPLQPRLYSIASSLAATPDEAHLTVTTVRYDLHGEPRAGVASSYFAERAAPDTRVPVYVQSNPHFRLAGDDTPILMIGAGTGIAPYRAFLQQREAGGAKGKSWLILGERNFHTDFLYQTEWQGLLKDGVLTRLNVAFSRDRAPKTYVQHRLHEHAHDVYAWLEEGGHIYVCGDATHLAPDVHAALGAVVQKAGGLTPDAAREYLGALQREHRYQTDVY